MLNLPPGFVAVPDAPDPFAAAVAAARADGDPGRLYWNDRHGRCEAAIVLAPDRMLAAGTLRDLGLVALFDAVAALAPPQVPLHADAATLLIDAARAGWVRTALAEGGVPGWAVLGLHVLVAPLGNDPGLHPDETSLAEEGFGDVTAGDVVEGLCRYLLVWIDAWREDGPAVLARAAAARRVAAGTVPA